MLTGPTYEGRDGPDPITFTARAIGPSHMVVLYPDRPRASWWLVTRIATENAGEPWIRAPEGPGPSKIRDARTGG